MYKIPLFIVLASQANTLIYPPPPSLRVLYTLEKEKKKYLKIVKP